jgi:hypothetical protein
MKIKDIFSFGKRYGQGFNSFLSSEKLSFSNFFYIYAGALAACFLLGGYLLVLSFSPLFSIGNLLLLWAGWLVFSFPLSRQDRFQRVILWSNNIMMSVSFFWMAHLFPSEWIVVLLPYFVFALLLINFMQASFSPTIDMLVFGSFGVVGLIHFYFRHSSLFASDESKLLSLFFLMIMALSGAAFFVWGGIRSKKSLYKIYSQRQELEETATVLEIRIKAKTKELQEQSQLLRDENTLKTDALRRRIDELERFRRMVVGRELKMVELKEALIRAEKALKKPTRNK